MPKRKDEKTDGRCPNCGYCPHCGQSAQPRPVPMPYPVAPWRVYPRPAYNEELGPPYRVWCGGQTRGIEGTPSIRYGNEATA